jgi:hypothetical protein
MCRLITVTVKLCLPEGVRETTEFRRLGVAEEPRHRTDDTNMFTLEQATKAQRGSRCIALLFVNLGTRCVGLSAPRPGRFVPGNAHVPIV